jgi:hypothetical protein
MKIGDTTVTNIPPRQSVPCKNGCSGGAVAYFNGTPYCAECLREEQQLKWNQDGQFFENSEGDRVHYEIVNKLS